MGLAIMSHQPAEHFADTRMLSPGSLGFPVSLHPPGPHSVAPRALRTESFPKNPWVTLSLSLDP